MLSGAGRVPDVFETLGPLLAAAGYDVRATSTRPAVLPRVVEQVATTARERSRAEVLVVHLYSGRAFLTEDVVSRLAGGRLVGVLAGGGFPAFAERHPGWVRRVLARFGALVAPSPYLARWAASVTTTPVTVIPNPLDLGPYDFRRRGPAAPSLLWLRAFHEIYAPEVAVAAAADLAADRPDARLTMVGADKGRRDEIRAEVARRGLEEVVTVGGFADAVEKRRLFAAHDVFLNTSRVDNRPVSVVEAGASGLCIVSTNVGGVPDLVEDEVSALLVPPDDPEAVAAAVRRLVDDTGLAERLSAGGRAVAEAGRPETVVARWHDLLSRRGSV